MYDLTERNKYMATILVVEDDRLLRKAIREELEEAGFQVEVAENSTEVFKVLESNQINLIYLDIMLPGEMNGYAILKQLKLPDSPHKAIQVIMLSNLGQLDEIDSAMQLGAADFIVKASIDLPRLVEITRTKLGLS
jgi:DNA-binding response OmpR family regulator